MTFGVLAKKASKFAIDHSPQILTSIGVVGAVSTAYLAAKGAWTAADLVRLKEADDVERGAEITDPREILKDRIELTWRLFVPAGVTGALTVACIIGAANVSARRTAAFAALYSISEKGLDEYKDKVAEKFGDRKEEQVRNEIMQDRMDEVIDGDVRLSGINDYELCYDKFGSLFFKGSVEGIRSVVNDFNRMLLHDGLGSLADFYRMLDLNEVPSYAESIGWNSDNALEVQFSSTLLHGVRPVICIEFKKDPIVDYGRFRGF